MKKILFLLLFYSSISIAQTHELPRTSPESQGIRSECLINMFDSLMALPKTDIHSVVVLRNGKVIGEMYPKPFSPESSHILYSCSKTFVGAAVGIAISENRLRLSDRIITFFPECVPDSISDNLASITVQDLLRMTSGITPDWNMRNICSDWITRYFSKKTKQPGTKFEYDSTCSYLLSAIVQKVTGMSLLDYLKDKIFNPLNITNVEWEVSPEGYNTGGWGLRLQSESLAKFGLLLLNKGNWKGQQLIPENWVKDMMSRHFEAGKEDYCYHMWQCDYPGAVRADGAFGQYIIVVPRHNAVVVVTECSLINGMRQRHIIYNNLFKDLSDTPLQESKQTFELTQKQEGYSLPLLKGRKHSNQIKKIDNRVFSLKKNPLKWESLKIEKEEDQLYLTIVDADQNKTKLLLKYNEWSENTTNSNPPYSIDAVGRFKGITGPFKVAACYAWDKGCLNIKIHYTDWISAVNLNISEIEKEKYKLSIKTNYSKDTTEMECNAVL